jgi:hypothetical protein
VQLINGQTAKLDKIDAQAANTQKTEPRGSRIPTPTVGRQPLEAADAYAAVQAKWQKANPGRTWDRSVQDRMMPEIIRLQMP